MANAEIRVYGLIVGISQENAAELQERFETAILEYDATNGRRELSVEFEGLYFFIEDFLDTLVPLLDADGEAKIDYIDQHEWRMDRYMVRPSGYEVKAVNLNDVLERYNQE
jgi:hypothetical protein